MDAKNHCYNEQNKNIACDIKKDEVNILHLSDLHFGIENDSNQTGIRQRFRQKELFKKLIDTLKDDATVPLDWKPNVVVISGDVAWRGELNEYEMFEKEFLAPLTETLGITREKIITCPGNHDIIRDQAEDFERPYKNQKDLQVKKISRDSIGKKRKLHFENYVNILCAGDPQQLCREVRLPEWPWVRFLVMNSAWDCRDDKDEGTLRVGLDLLEEIAGEQTDREVIVSVFHHPHTQVDDYDTRSGMHTKRNWLHVSEREPQQDGGRCFSNFLESRSDFILNGHIHKETKPQHSQEAKSIQLISGAAYSTDTPRYHCRILKLRFEDESLYRDIRCTLGGGDYSWEVTTPKNFRVFGLIRINTQKKRLKQEQTQRLLAKAQEAILLGENQQCVDELKTVIQEMMQYIVSGSNIENKFENSSHLQHEEGHDLEPDSTLRLKGPR